MLPATSSPPPPPPPGVPTRAQSTFPPLPPPPPPPRKKGEAGPVGRPGTRRWRPRGKALNDQSVNSKWHTAVNAAIAKGPKMEWMFRWHYPKPGDENEHTTFVNSVLELETWPTEEQLQDGSFVMLFPSHWRRWPFNKCVTMNDFWETKVYYQWAAAWNASGTQACKRKGRNWGSHPDYSWAGNW